MPTSSSKIDIPSTSIKVPNLSFFDPYDQTPTIEKLQKENVELLQLLE
jgi:hypothetical protein